MKRTRGAPTTNHMPTIDHILKTHYPLVLRLARALSGREDVAEGVVRFVLARGARLAGKWNEVDDAGRWFLHHTVLTVRRAARHEPEPALDLLAKGAPAHWVAFVKSIRSLPPQQCEAVLLHHGEHLNQRYLGVAMDCSTTAAQTHLQAGEKTLHEMHGDLTDGLLAHLATVFKHIGRVEEDAVIAAVTRSRAGGRAKRWARVVAFLAIVGALGFVVWKLRLIERLFQ